MARKFDELKEGMSPEARQRAEVRTEETLRKLPRSELRQAHRLSADMLTDTSADPAHAPEDDDPARD
ncbi:hypothetical protein [Arhodomonas sp. AD133]|uniref:hypothetical protein n=1 Tax=Arhodomonas sp. AD133 TaxID=3415009 RepID=UPI003EBE9DD6